LYDFFVQLGISLLAELPFKVTPISLRDAAIGEHFNNIYNRKPPLFVMKSSSMVQLNQLNQIIEWLSRKKCVHVDQVSGRRILICEPGK